MIIKVKVKPGSREERIKKVGEGYEISVKERAEGGKANRKIINLLAIELGVSWKMIKIKNPKSKNKIVEVK